MFKKLCVTACAQKETKKREGVKRKDKDRGIKIDKDECALV